jgi:hypothetical protein
VIVALVAAGYVIYRMASKPPATASVTASSGRLTRDSDDGGHLAAVSRRERPEVWYRVTLAGAPVGAQLDLICDWSDPAGRVAHRNRYRTRVIDRPAWPTHARYRLGPGSPTGTWTVRLGLDGRVLHATSFEVRD